MSEIALRRQIAGRGSFGRALRQLRLDDEAGFEQLVVGQVVDQAPSTTRCVNNHDFEHLQTWRNEPRLTPNFLANSRSGASFVPGVSSPVAISLLKSESSR